MKRLVIENQEKLIKTVVALLFPFLGSTLYCYIRNTNIWQLYLPNSFNNDVLFYYKQVEGMISGGIAGYFGFNETHALYGGFAAWNPIILIPWYVWGLLFGWNYMAPIICNIFLFSIALVSFVILVNPKWKNIVTIFVLFLLFPGLWIHLLNGLPEIIITSCLIVFFALMIRYSESKKKSFLYVAIVFAIYLTIARPYMVIFLLYALICLTMCKCWYGYVISVVTLALTVLTYYFTNYYLTAAYFEPLYDTSLIKAIMELRLRDAYYILGAAIKNTVPGVLGFLLGAYSFGSTTGTQYIINLLCIAFSLVWIVTEKSQNRKNKGLFAAYAIAGVSLLAAIVILLGKPNEGGRHCFAFAVVGILLLSLTVDDLCGRINSGILAIFLVIFICKGALIPTDYDIPMPNKLLAEEIEYWKTVMPLDGSSGYENTIIWALSDTVNGQGTLTDFHGLYAMPAQMGINCCDYPYLINCIEELKSKYVAVASGGYFEERLLELEYDEVGRTETLAVYKKE